MLYFEFLKNNPVVYKIWRSEDGIVIGLGSYRLCINWKDTWGRRKAPSSRGITTCYWCDTPLKQEDAWDDQNMVCHDPSCIQTHIDTLNSICEFPDPYSVELENLNEIPTLDDDTPF